MRNNNVYGKPIPTKTVHWGWQALGWIIALLGWVFFWVNIAERIVG